MTLIEVVERLGAFDDDDTIYAAVPWSKDSAAIVVPEPDSGEPPSGLEYLLEVAIAREVLESLANESAADKCSRLIQYATDDA